MELLLQYIGEDDWNREVYKNIESGAIYKRYKGEETFYTASSFYGEPEYTVRPIIQVTILTH